MTLKIEPVVASTRLAQRLGAVADLLIGTPPIDGDSSPTKAGDVLETLVRAVQSDRSHDRVWLLCTAVFGAYPTPDDVISTARYLQLQPAADASRWLLARASDTDAALRRELQRVADEEQRDRKAARRAAFSTEHPTASKYLVGARGSIRHAAGRVPRMKRVGIAGWQRLVSIRARFAIASGALRRHLVSLSGGPSGAHTSADANDADVGAVELRVVSDRVVVDVDHSARFDLHTGIQQVVRQTLPLWERDHPVVAVAWTASSSGLRPLCGPERQRVSRGPAGPGQSPTGAAGQAGTGVTATGDGAEGDGSGPSHSPHRPGPEPGLLEGDPGADTVLIVPWRTVVVLLETPPSPACDRLAALARYSGNALVAVGYDCVPIVSADLVPPADPQRFTRYLSALKYARRIAGISRSATHEFAGFGAALPAQGLPAPTVVECTLPTQFHPNPATPPTRPTTPAPPARPTPQPGQPPSPASPPATGRPPPPCLDQRGQPRTPQKPSGPALRRRTTLARPPPLPTPPRRRQRLGRRNPPPHHPTPPPRPTPHTRTKISDTELANAYRHARFSVFASLHEGYGLPVAESLALGTPVITTNYGSTQQIAAPGGAILIDPRDDHALLDAMRALLTDDHLLHTLQTQIHTRPTRTWEHYAHDLWTHLVQPELALEVLAAPESTD